MFDEAPDPDALTALNDDPGVAATALLDGGRLADRRRRDRCGGDRAAQGIDRTDDPRVVERSSNDGEIVLGPSVMDSHRSAHRGLGHRGSSERVGDAHHRRHRSAGVGGELQQRCRRDHDAVRLRALRHADAPSTTRAVSSWRCVWRLAPTSTAVRSQMAGITGGFERVIGDSFRPARILNISRVRSVPQIIEVFAAPPHPARAVHSLATVASSAAA